MKTLIIALTGILLTLGTQAADRSHADTRVKPGDVTEARVISEAADGTNWLVGGRTFDEQHFSPLKQLTDKNIGGLGLAWALDIYSATGMSSEPIIVDGVIYVTAPRSVVYAVDGLSGKVLWTFAPKMEVGMDKWQAARASRTNRGVAVWAGKVYVGTGDCRLVAIDALVATPGLRSHFERARFESGGIARHGPESPDLLSRFGVESRDRSSHSRVRTVVADIHLSLREARQ